MNSVGHLKFGRTGTANYLPVKSAISQIEHQLTTAVNRNLAALPHASALKTPGPALKKPARLILPKTSPIFPSNWAKRSFLSGTLAAALSAAAIGLAIYANYRCPTSLASPHKTVTSLPGSARYLAIGSSSIIASDVIRFLISEKYPRLVRIAPGLYRPIKPDQARKHKNFYIVPKIFEILFKLIYPKKT